MPANTILMPMLALMLLTLAVWILLYVRRIAYMKANRIDAQRVSTPEKAAELIPEHVQNPAYNFKNLFELPVLFYGLCLYLYVTGSADAVYVIAGWAFVGLRAVHSLIQCTTNVVMHRFVIYMAGAAALWFMLLRAVLQAI
ncbi:MAG: MAPEG family protein [Woeseiaceae bacterium]|nr:MAPEG family protein [Woeseiaceae bacterium]